MALFFGAFFGTREAHSTTPTQPLPQYLNMFRLKASEITLTPADVDETLIRMQRQQATNPHPTLPASIYGPRLPPRLPPLFGPRMRRGPGRSRDDAIAALGNIPILRPHHVALESTHDVDNASPYTGAMPEDSESDSNESSTSSLAGDQTPNAASTSRHIPSPARSAELPFRPVPSARLVASEAASSALISEYLPSSPSKQLLGPSSFGKVRTNSSEDDNQGASRIRIHAATDGQVDDPDTPQAMPTNRIRALGQHDSFNLVPRQHMLAASSPRQRGGSGDPESVCNMPNSR